MSKPCFTATGTDIIKVFKRDFKGPNAIDIKKKQDTIYRDILRIGNEIMLNTLLVDGHVKLGETLGFIEIRKKKKSRSGKLLLQRDYKRSNETGKTCYQFNAHTDGFIFEINWNKTANQIILVDRFQWELKIDRTFKRKILAPLVREKKVDYPEIKPKTYKKKPYAVPVR